MALVPLYPTFVDTAQSILVKEIDMSQTMIRMISGWAMIASIDRSLSLNQTNQSSRHNI
jgi:hypothetical protein